MTATETVLVDASNRIVFADDRMPAVLSTPWLVAYLEYAARRAIEPCLEEHERSVGTRIDVEHLGPVPEGNTVQCRACVIRAEGNAVTFQVEAADGGRLVARGIHKRRVIDADRFRRVVSRLKQTPQQG